VRDATAIEVWEDPGAAWGLGVDTRLRELGMAARLVRTHSEAPPGRGGAAALLVNALLPETSLDACLERHGGALREAATLGIVMGRSVPRGRRQRLREAGFGLFLGAPVDPAALRFHSRRAPGPPRHHLRAPLRIRAEVRAHDRVKDARLYTASEGGAFLETPRPWMEGTPVELHLPGVLDGAPLAARVVYTNVPGNLMQRLLPVGMGVRFETLDEEQARALRTAIRERCEALLL
jgi:hypothetical protein